MYYTTFSPKVSRAFHNFFYFKTNLGVFNNTAVIQLLVFVKLLLAEKPESWIRMPRKRAFGQAFREKLAESSRGRASRSRRKSDVKIVL